MFSLPWQAGIKRYTQGGIIVRKSVDCAGYQSNRMLYLSLLNAESVSTQNVEYTSVKLLQYTVDCRLC